MSAVFVDTSAAYALLVRSDDGHEAAVQAFHRLRQEGARLVTTSCVLVECYALLQRRAGMDAVRDMREGLGDLLETLWVGADLHESGLDDIAHRDSKSISLVDAVSFAAMRAHSIDRAFTFDQDFEAEGFGVLG